MAWSAALAAGIAATSSAIGTYAQNRANTNLNIRNRRWQEDMFKKETDYNTEMWNKQNEYNTASAQRSRLEEAGLNPYLMMSGSDAGTASSTSSPSAGTPSTTPYDYSGISNGIGNAAQMYLNGTQQASQTELLRQQVEAQRLANKYYELDIMAKIRNLNADTHGKEQHSAYEKYLTDFGLASFNSDMQYKNYQNEYMQHMSEKTLQDSLVSQMNVGLLAKELQGFDEKRKAELKQMAASTYAAYASGALSYESAKTQIAQQLLIGKQGKYVDSQTEGQNIQNGINKKTANYQAARIMHEMSEAKWRAVHAKNNKGPENYYQAQYGRLGNNWFDQNVKTGALDAISSLHFFK